MTTSSTSNPFWNFLVSTDKIIPHDVLGAVLIAVFMILAAFKIGPPLLWEIISAMIAVGIAADLSAHGWTH